MIYDLLCHNRAARRAPQRASGWVQLGREGPRIPWPGYKINIHIHIYIYIYMYICMYIYIYIYIYIYVWVQLGREVLLIIAITNRNS